MKKVIAIVVLGLFLVLIPYNLRAELKKDGTFILPKDVVKYPHKWKTAFINSLKDYSIQVVSSNVRFGKKSIRFELRPGDCGVSKSGYSDCKNKSERHELVPQNKDRDIGYSGITWHSISFFAEKFDTSKYDHNSLFQFHGDGDGAPSFNFSLDNSGFTVQRRTACNVKEIAKKYGGGNWKSGLKACSTRWKENAYLRIMSKKEMFNKWNDVVFNIKWSEKQKGFLKMWINGGLIYHYIGSTDTPNESTAFQFGIYRYYGGRSISSGINQVAYFDEIRFAKGKKSCKKLKLDDLGYNCKDLENQSISIIDKIY